MSKHLRLWFFLTALCMPVVVCFSLYYSYKINTHTAVSKEEVTDVEEPKAISQPVRNSSKVDEFIMVSTDGITKVRVESASTICLQATHYGEYSISVVNPSQGITFKSDDDSFTYSERTNTGGISLNANTAAYIQVEVQTPTDLEIEVHPVDSLLASDSMMNAKYTIADPGEYEYSLQRGDVVLLQVPVGSYTFRIDELYPETDGSIQMDIDAIEEDSGAFYYFEYPNKSASLLLQSDDYVTGGLIVEDTSNPAYIRFFNFNGSDTVTVKMSIMKEEGDDDEQT